MNDNLTKLPNNLPEPKDDGDAEHLLGMMIPNMVLQSNTDGLLDINSVDCEFMVLYFFPTMDISGKLVSTKWNNIPGARGCTPQNISINENKKEFEKYNAIPIGISIQSIDELIKISSIQGFSQLLLSDSGMEFQKKLQIPTFRFGNKTMYKRITLIVKNSEIIKVFYPVFPPDIHVFKILNWLKKNSTKLI